MPIIVNIVSIHHNKMFDLQIWHDFLQISVELSIETIS